MKKILYFLVLILFFSVCCFAKKGVDTSFSPISGGQSNYSYSPISPSSSKRVWKDPYLGMEFVWVPGGCYKMGCGPWTASCNDGEKPVHTVCVDGFWMGKYEVTFAQYDRFCEETGISKRDDKGWGRGNRPVINVSWYEARLFARWLSKKTGKKFRLPTEAEWEYACRSGGKTVKYAWGNGSPYINGKKASNIADESAKRKFSGWIIWKGYDDGYVYTSPVGTFAPNALGLYDMCGNVCEWCFDWYDSNYYSNSPRNNPKGPPSGSCRVIRGGAWSVIPKNLQCARRDCGAPFYRSRHVGFRLVVEKW